MSFKTCGMQNEYALFYKNIFYEIKEAEIFEIIRKS